ncbi:MAG: hypothetical protein U9R15_17735 [Chloroflexota bacterium]|nr:hypothetical protein [Chloroflexota bacterium]
MIPVLIILGLVILLLALVLGIAIGLGWLLTLVLPFTLFEGTLLVMAASAFIGTVGYNLVRALSDFIPRLLSDPDFYDYEDDEEDEYYDDIPTSRFFKTSAEQTWGTWFRYEIANDIYVEFQAAPKRIAPMGDRQLQELAIRLADIAVAILKAKTSRAKRLEITKSALQRQMTRNGQRPYDDDILNLAANAIGASLEYYYEDFIDVIQGRLWNEPTDMFSTG